MADGEYFKYFPTVPYDTFDGSGQYRVVTDIFKRVRATLGARNDKTIYYNYYVRDKERPEHLAYKYYGDVRYHWVILLMNEIRDPQWCWPLDMNTFDKYIIEKYGSAEVARAQHSHYETKEILAPATDDNYTVGDVVLPAGQIIHNGDTFTYSYTSMVNGVPTTTRTWGILDTNKAVFAYDKELQDNEDKRKIIFLRRNLLPEFVSEFEGLVVKKR
jgi:hypothetical protein